MAGYMPTHIMSLPRPLQRPLAGRVPKLTCGEVPESGEMMPDLLDVLRVMTCRAHCHFEDGWR